jgi:hypothetical protein
MMHMCADLRELVSWPITILDWQVCRFALFACLIFPLQVMCMSLFSKDMMYIQESSVAAYEPAGGLLKHMLGRYVDCVCKDQ